MPSKVGEAACKTKGCDSRKHYAFGLCKPCWFRQRETNPDVPRCVIADCEGPMVARGLCHKHYQRVRAEERRDDSHTPRCDTPGCKDVVHTKGMCQRHYNVWRRGRPEPPTAIDPHARTMGETIAMATTAIVQAELPPRIESRLTTRVLLATQPETVYRTLRDAEIW